MMQGYGDAYRQGLADWHAIIDGLAKPTFDGVLPLADLAGAMAEARAAAMPDPRQAALKRTIAEIRARALGEARTAGRCCQRRESMTDDVVWWSAMLASCMRVARSTRVGARRHAGAGVARTRS